MLRKPGCCGSTRDWGEMRMWASCVGLMVAVMLLIWHGGHMDRFRILFFGSPFWITCLIGPLSKEANVFKKVGWAAFMVVFYWSVLQCYPAQCRHAWGTMMVGDSTYWGNDTAIRDAILQQKDSFYVLKSIAEQEQVFVDPASLQKQKKRRAAPGVETETNNVRLVYEMLQSMDTDGVDAVHPRIKKWIAPLTGGYSLDLLKLRAYCTIHQGDVRLPHIYPLTPLGIPEEVVKVTTPCPLWTCLMTEARTDGKLPFFAWVAGVAMLNYVHYRCDCCSYLPWLLGTGQPRRWWLWFWATLVPLWAVLLVKTTIDGELSDILLTVIGGSYEQTTTWLVEDKNKILLGLLALGALAVYVYWERVRRALGLDLYPTLPFLLSRQQEDDQRSFQVCLWKVDLHADSHIEALERHGGGKGADGDPQRGSTRELSAASSVGSPSAWLAAALTGGRSLSFFGLQEDTDALRTHDGRVPSLGVRVYYGEEEIQRTRAVKPTSTEWHGKGSVYFQENFKITVEYQPRAAWRVEVRDTSAPLGPVSLGDVSFDEGRLQRQFDISRKAQRDAHAVPTLQVVGMLEARGSTPQGEAEQLRHMKNIGFMPHRLSDGGAVWLAFCELESASRSTFAACC